MVYHDISQEQLLLLITQAVQAELQKRSRQVPVGISVRHIHLTRDDVDKLFGYGYQLTPKKALSQPGQFACEECLDIIGPKGELKHVRILGPERSALRSSWRRPTAATSASKRRCVPAGIQRVRRA